MPGKLGTYPGRERVRPCTSEGCIARGRPLPDRCTGGKHPLLRFRLRWASQNRPASHHRPPLQAWRRTCPSGSWIISFESTPTAKAPTSPSVAVYRRRHPQSATLRNERAFSPDLLPAWQHHNLHSPGRSAARCVASRDLRPKKSPSIRHQIDPITAAFHHPTPGKPVSTAGRHSGLLTASRGSSSRNIWALALAVRADDCSCQRERLSTLGSTIDTAA